MSMHFEDDLKWRQIAGLVNTEEHPTTSTVLLTPSSHGDLKLNAHDPSARAA
jgi:hypothetical protein